MAATVYPFAEMRRFRRQVDRLFSGYDDRADLFPATNVWANDGEVVIKAEVPGVDPKAVDLSVERDQVTIQGERTADEPAAEVVCHRNERGSGKFARTFRLPYEVDSNKVGAVCANGVLTITLPGAESSKPKRIAVSTE